MAKLFFKKDNIEFCRIISIKGDDFMSEPSIFAENNKLIEDIRSKFRALDLPKIDIPNIDELYESYNFEIEDFENPLIKLAEEQNDSLKVLVKHNEEISIYNKELVSLNKKILNKINSLDDTLTFLNSAFSDKAKKDYKNSEQQLGLLLELITIIESKDSSKLELFMSNVGAPVAVGLMVEALKIKFGLG